MNPQISTHVFRGKVVITISTKLQSSEDIKIVKHADHVLIYVPIIKDKE